MKGGETRARIFQAAMQLAARDGLLTLTLEKVAEESGLSKGGVMHHFATKEALLSGVIFHFTDLVETEMTRRVAEDPNPSFRWVRAMLSIMHGENTEEPGTPSSHPSKQMLERFMLSVMAATVHNPELAKPVQAIGQRLRGRLTAVPEEGLEQLILWLVMDGLYLWQFVGMLDANDPLIEQVHDNLQQKLQALSNRTPSATPAPLDRTAALPSGTPSTTRRRQVSQKGREGARGATKRKKGGRSK